MIELHNVTKRYGENIAVDDLSLVVPPGRIMGFLGPNGVGKSTTMRLILATRGDGNACRDLVRNTAGGIALFVGLLFLPGVTAILPATTADAINPYLPLDAGSAVATVAGGRPRGGAAGATRRDA
jgi:hypothetical protein